MGGLVSHCLAGTRNIPVNVSEELVVYEKLHPQYHSPCRFLLGQAQGLTE